MPGPQTYHCNKCDWRGTTAVRKIQKIAIAILVLGLLAAGVTSVTIVALAPTDDRGAEKESAVLAVKVFVTAVVAAVLLAIAIAVASIYQRCPRCGNRQLTEQVEWEPGKYVDVISTDSSPGGVYTAMRTCALATRRADLAIADPSADAPVWGILMEMSMEGTEEATATLFTLVDGTASLYTSTGGGVIGGQAHETVRRAVAQFIAAANQLRGEMKPAENHPVPGTGRMRFFALTDSAVLTVSSREESLSDGSSLLSPLYAAGQEVITQLRLASGGRGSSRRAVG